MEMENEPLTHKTGAKACKRLHLQRDPAGPGSGPALHEPSSKPSMCAADWQQASNEEAKMAPRFQRFCKSQLQQAQGEM